MNKKVIIATLFSCIALGFTACSDDEDSITTITFESADLGSIGYINNADYTEGNYVFTNVYNKEYGSWYGYAISNHTNDTIAGWSNQYSVYAGCGANGSKNFAVAFVGAEYDENWNSTPVYPVFSRTDMAEFAPKSAQFALTTYTYLSIKNGDDYAKKFEAGDYYRVIVKGTAANGEQRTVEFDAVNIDNNVAFTQWSKIDLSKLGNVAKVEIAFESTDTGDYGINTPVYIAIDNIEIAE